MVSSNKNMMGKVWVITLSPYTGNRRGRSRNTNQETHLASVPFATARLSDMHDSASPTPRSGPRHRSRSPTLDHEDDGHEEDPDHGENPDFAFTAHQDNPQ